MRKNKIKLLDETVFKNKNIRISGSLKKTYYLNNHGLVKFHMKHLLQEETKVIIEKEFSFTVECCVRGYHIFQSSWEAPVGSVLIAKHEYGPQSLIDDKFAIALVNNNDSATVGHVPKFMSKLTYVFLKHGRHIKCEITGGKKYSKDLEQGGLEILLD